MKLITLGTTRTKDYSPKTQPAGEVCHPFLDHCFAHSTPAGALISHDSERSAVELGSMVQTHSNMPCADSISNPSENRLDKSPFSTAFQFVQRTEIPSFRTFSLSFWRAFGSSSKTLIFASRETGICSLTISFETGARRVFFTLIFCSEIVLFVLAVRRPFPAVLDLVVRG